MHRRVVIAEYKVLLVEVVGRVHGWFGRSNILVLVLFEFVTCLFVAEVQIIALHIIRQPSHLAIVHVIRFIHTICSERAHF